MALLPANLNSVDAVWALVLDDGVKYGADFLGAVIIIVVGLLIANWSSHTVRRALARQPWMDATLVPLVSTILRYSIIVVAVLAVFGQFGVQFNSVIALIGAAGLAIGLALQNTLTNVASGVMLLMLRPFRVGDSIQSGTYVGTADEIGLFTTILRTDDGKIVSLPNTLLFSGPIVNQSRRPIRQTQKIVVQIPYGSDVTRALGILGQIGSGEPRLLKDAPPTAGLLEFGDTAIKLTVQFTTLAGDADAMRFALNLAIHEQFEAAEIAFADGAKSFVLTPQTPPKPAPAPGQQPGTNSPH